MTTQATADMLRSMKMSAMAAEFERQLLDPAFRSLGFEERMNLLVNAEYNRRQNGKIARLQRNANFSAPHAAMEEIEYFEDRRLDKAQMLRFSTCRFIEDGRHIVLKGASGNGKTYIACAIGNAACRHFKTVRYIRMPELLDELSLAKGCGELQKVLKSYKKVDLLIVDEWLIRCLTQEESYNLLEIVEARCGQEHSRSMIFCTQYETDGWYRRINPDPDSDSPISEAIMDRIVHNAHHVMIGGRISMRERHGLQYAEADRA